MQIKAKKPVDYVKMDPRIHVAVTINSSESEHINACIRHWLREDHGTVYLTRFDNLGSSVLTFAIEYLKDKSAIKMAQKAYAEQKEISQHTRSPFNMNKFPIVKRIQEITITEMRICEGVIL